MKDSQSGLKGLLLKQIDTSSSVAGERLLGSAASLRRIAVELRSDELGRSIAGLADLGVVNLERVGSYLTDSDGDRLITDVETFGRERPLALAATGLVLGIVGSRILKASASRNRHVDESSPSFGGRA